MKGIYVKSVWATAVVTRCGVCAQRKNAVDMARPHPAKKFAIYDVELTGNTFLPTTRFRNVNRPAPSSEDTIKIKITWGIPSTNLGVRATPDNTDHDDCPTPAAPKEVEVKNI